MYKLICDNNADIAQCGHYIVFSKTRKKCKNKNYKTTKLDSIQAIESLCYNKFYDVSPWNKLYKLDIFNTIRFPEGKIYEDTAISYLVAEKADKLIVNMTPKYYYIQRYNSTANGIAFSDKKYQFIDVGDDMADYILRYYPELYRGANAKRVFVRLSTLSQIINSKHNDKERIKEIKYVVNQYGLGVLFDRKASKRDKLGIIALKLGVPFYCIIWRLYYKIVRRK